jgi:valyl-tRNA synthetase
VEKNFDFKSCETIIYKNWQENQYFRATPNKNKKPYTVIMPPPNVTARLHIGHAFDDTIQDIICRHKRMQGFEVLYLPGADHAAIATEVKIIDELKKQGIDKNTLTREQFMVHVDKWYEIYTNQIKDQIRRMGLSVDWSRFSFTMDKSCAAAVTEVFNNLYKKGLIYKGKRMVNTCPGCKSALSDAEVEYKTIDRIMYHIRYDDIIVATVRPETIPGDVAVAVNPADKRYAKFVGKFVTNPMTGTKIPVIADEYVDMKFGTGALKITPAHDMADYEIGLRHNLEPIIVADLGDEARKKSVAHLKKTGALVAEKKYTGNVAVCYRCFRPVEPSISSQWFIAMQTLAKPAIEAVESGKLKIQPKKFEKIYLHWLKNIRDWCISRQLTSGYRIPIEGETDVLDTWFSSALWPFCTLGWPEKTEDFKYFYPTQTMVMAYEIIFFWAIRMVFQGIEHTGTLPFENLLLHGLVRDGQGRKMSKSLGNGIDPVKIIDEFGVDVLRFSIISGTKLDRDPRYSIEKATLARNFINKIWNATKFYSIMQDSQFNFKNLRPADEWILTKLNATIKSVSKKYEKFDFGVAANELQHFFWATFCDWYIEESKQTSNREVFGHVIETFLKLVSPIMPFVTEQIWTNEFKKGKTIMFEPFPEANKKFNFKSAIKFDEYIEKKRQDRNAAGESEKNAARIKELENEIKRGNNILGNAGFVKNAPKELVSAERAKLEKYTTELIALKSKMGSAAK